jgi:ATP synthase protein I
MTDNDPAGLDSFDAKLKAARERSPAPESKSEADGQDRSGLATGMRLSAELISGILLGLGIGWGLDRWLGTGPWLLLVFMVLGTTAGIMTVVRAGNRMDQRADAAATKARTNEAETNKD